MTNLALYVFFAKNSIMRIGVITNDALKDELLASWHAGYINNW